MSSYSAKNRQVRKQYSLSVVIFNPPILVRERIETLEELIVNSGHPLETIEGKINLSSKDKYVSTNKNLSSQQSHPQQQQIPFSVSSVKRDSMVAASQISQKIKSTYKLKTSGKIFKGQSSSSSSHLIGTFEWHKDGVWYITSSQRNSRQYIATASADSTVNICDVTKIDYNLSPSTVYSGHQSSVNCVKFNPNNDLMLTASGDGTAHIWKFLPEQRESDLESPSNNNEEATIIKTPLLELNEHHNVVVSCDWLSGVDQCVTASWDQMANIYDYHTGEMIVELVGHDQALTDVCAHDSARLIVTSSQDTTFRLWDFRDAIHSVSVFQGHSRSVTSTCFLSADKIISGGDDRTVKIWDLKNMRSPLVTISMESGINKLSVSKQHNLFAIPLDNRNVRIYDINGNRICRLSRDSHNRMVTCSTWLNPIENSIAPNAPSSSSSSALNVHQSSSSLAHKSNSITLFTCAFDRRICAWNIMTEKQ
ncbi:WD repeat-containing protein 37-like protein [Sarcoptes scabiei]|uniref:WD repeat-containing protein 37 n=1 Tax=Sarcoptes scabiei TaxID=52283 RepID=A0A132AHQ9_SARSC|nr:WD repeat-containing protein 37-like protein [Sarcoptes scabiei]